jgi:hypothetical protein
VPAAAVKRGGQALFAFTGRKGLVGCLLVFNKTFHSLSVFFVLINASLSLAEDVGTFDGGVKSVEINWRTTVRGG